MRPNLAKFAALQFGRQWPLTAAPGTARRGRYWVKTGHGSQRSARRFMQSRPEEFHPEPLTEPDLILSHHPARAIARRLPPSAEPSGSSWFDPVGPRSTAMTHPLRSTGITPASSLLQGSPPLSGASVLSASRLEPLAPFPLGIAGQVLTFHTRARLSFAPPTCRMPLGQSQCIPQAYPGRWVSPRF